MQEYKKHESKLSTNINNQSSPNYSTKINKNSNPLKSLSPKLTGNFQKASSTCNINTSGSHPIIVFKKEHRENFDIEFKKKMNNQKNSLESKYISDGGLKQKLEKYNSNSSQLPRTLQKSIKSPKNYNKNALIEQDSKDFQQRQRKKNLEEQKLFSKTVRESNKRPVFPKGKGGEKECYKTRTGFGLNNNHFGNKKTNSQKHIHGNKNNIGNSGHNNAPIEDSKEEEERKNLCMRILIENAVRGEIIKYNKVKKPTKKELVIERKKEKIREVNEDFEEELNEEYEEIKEEENTSKSNNNNHGNLNTNNTNKNNNIIVNTNINAYNKTYFSNNNDNTTKKLKPVIPVKLNNYINSYEGDQFLQKKKKKNKIKPSVNQFEFLDKIKLEQKKLPISSEFHKRSMSSDINYNLASSKSHPNLNLNDSFRRKNPNLNIDNINNIEEIKNNNININNPNNRNIMKNNYMGNYNYNKSNDKKFIPSNNNYMNYDYNNINESILKTFEDGNDDFPYAHKKSHRTKKELKQFVKEKRIKDKQDEERKLLEKNKKLFLLFKNLHNLNLKDINDQGGSANNQYPTQTPSQSQTQIPSTQLPNQTQLPSYQNFQRAKQQKTMSSNDKSNRSNRTNRSNSNSTSNFIKKKKEVNEYYIGNDAIKNNSTLIDPNEYYLNVLESQQLLVNSGLKRIENETDSSEDKRTSQVEETITEINPKEKIQKITDKESKRFNESSSKKNSFLNTNNYEDLKQKIDNTLKRANEVFSKDNLKKYVNNITTSSLNDNENIDNDIDNESKINEKKSIGNSSTSSNKKKKQNDKKANKNQEPKIKIPSPEINIEASNTDKKVTKSGINTKEGPQPSLTHTYSTNSNPNKKVEIEMEPKDVLNFVEVIKFIIQRRVFIEFYEFYIQKAILNRLSIGFQFLVCHCKQYAYRKIEEYCNYSTYNYTFRQLIRPFLRRRFKSLVNFFFTQRKLEYLTILLTKIFKFKIFERIFIYSQYYEENAFKMIIGRIMSGIISPHLRHAFDKIKNYKKKPEKKIEPNKFLSDFADLINKVSNEKSEDEEEEEKEDEKKINKRKELPSKKSMNKPSKEIEIKTPESNADFNLESKDSKDFMDNRLQCEESDSSLNGSRSFLHRRKFEGNIKMNSYMYESLGDSSKSSINIEPNSFDNDKLHQLKLMLMMRNNMLEGQEDEEEKENENDEDNGFTEHSESKNSHRSLEGFNLGRKDGDQIKTLSDLVNDESKSGSKKSLNHIKINDESDELEDMKDFKKNKEKQGKGKKTNQNQDNKKNEGKESIKESIKKKEEKEEKEEENKKEDEKKNKKKNDKKNEPKKEENKKIDNINKNRINEIINEKNLNESEIDISAENESHNSIEWEYNLTSKGDVKNDKEKENEKEKKKDKKNEAVGDDLNISEQLKKEKEKDKKDIKLKESDNEDYENDFENLSSSEKEEEKKKQPIKNEINKEKDNKEEKKSNQTDVNKKNEEMKLTETTTNKINEVSNQEKDKKNDQIKNEEEKKIKENEEKEKIEKENSEKLKKLKDIEDPDKFADDLTDLILSEKLLIPEIKSSKKKLIPLKKFKYEKFDKLNDGQSNSLANSFSSVGNIRDNLSKEFGLGSNLSHLSLNDDLASLNESIMSQYSAHSVFNKTVKDKKKEHSLNLYFNLIAPKLIRIIRQEIYSKYDRIFTNISSPMKNCSEKLMISLALQDADMLRENYKSYTIVEDIETILDKENILKKFEKVNKKIRSGDNVASDNFYDNMLNDCIIDTTIELINKERYYGKNGEPLKWSSRTHELTFKYKKNEPKKLADYVCKNLLKSLHNRIGLISDNYDYLSSDQINIERDRRLVDTVKNDLDENEYQWNNLEMEETQLKVEATEMILDQLYNEVIEILEHIQFSRLRPDLYQHKSIYACEEIPKLSFQQTTTEDVGLVEAEDNVVI